VLLSNATDATIDMAEATGTILDDDVTLLGKRKATFTDVDGDRVTIKVSKGTLQVEDFTIVPSGVGAQLALVDFSGEAEFAGANLSITAKSAVGAAAVDVGYINASGVDLGAVLIQGDLGRIDAGNGADRKSGLLSLSADSIGKRGLQSQLPGGSMQSDIAGSLQTLSLSGGMHGSNLSVRGNIGSILIHGRVSGSSIRSDGKIAAINIAGDFAGDAANAAVISARGMLDPVTAGEALAIRSFRIGGSVDHALILAGYDRTGAAVNPDAAIGGIVVAGDWSASSLAAGTKAGADGQFGTDDDALISGDNPLVAKIASIRIKGAAIGSADALERFGFVAEEIGAFKSDGIKLTLTSGASNDLTGLPVGSSGTLTVREVA
jgi:hypothetical protein